ELRHFDPRANRAACDALSDELSSRHEELEGLGSTPRAGLKAQAGNRGDRWECFSPEPEAPDALEILGGGELARRMTLESEPGVLRAHAVPVVGYRDESGPPIAHLHTHARRAGIDGVFDQLLHHGGRSFHHLPGRNLVDQGVGQQAHAPGGIRARLRLELGFDLPPLLSFRLTCGCQAVKARGPAEENRATPLQTRKLVDNSLAFQIVFGGGRTAVGGISPWSWPSRWGKPLRL